MRGRIRGIGRLLAWLAALLPAGSALAHAGAILLCSGQYVMPGGDGRMLGHLPYDEAPPGQLVVLPGFGFSKDCLVHRDMAPDLKRLLDAASKVDGVRGHLFGQSCHRTVAYQSQVFCGGIGPGKACRNAAERARSSGPPGFSEHATGYALDFTVAPAPGCPVLHPCMANTPAGRWLLANGPRFGFELSFPQGNAQGVTWEPWHWRWVGYAITEPGAAQARLTFLRARRQFRAEPAVTDLGDRWIEAARGQGALPTLRPTPAPTPWHTPAPRPAPQPPAPRPSWTPTPRPTPTPWRSPSPAGTPTPWPLPTPSAAPAPSPSG